MSSQTQQSRSGWLQFLPSIFGGSEPAGGRPGNSPHATRTRMEMLEGRLYLSGVTDTEPNDTLLTAQSLDGFFNLTFNPDIGDASFPVSSNTSTLIPHAEITGTGNGSVDYYKFSGIAGGVVILDIDKGDSGVEFDNDVPGDVDTEIALWDSSWNLIAANDDSSPSLGAGGSTSLWDSFIQTILPATGTYYVGVAECPATAFGATSPATFTLEPDEYADGANLETVMPEVTLSVVNGDPGETVAAVASNYTSPPLTGTKLYQHKRTF